MQWKLLIFNKFFYLITLLLLGNIFQLLAHLPEGFSDNLVWQGSGYDQVIGLTFDAEGNMYFWKKAGTLYKLNADGTLYNQPVLDISEEVGNYGDHGLLTVALDPDFLNNGYVYLIYNVDRHHLLYYGTAQYDKNASIDNEATIGRVSRFQLDVADNFNSVVVNSRKVLIGESIHTGIPIMYLSHGADCVVFGNDGSLLVSAGDGTTYEGIFTGTGSSDKPSYIAQGLQDGILTEQDDVGAFRAQSLHSLNGKVLRIDPETGNGLASNPFFDAQNPRAAISRIWALGFRNPYRMIVQPNTGSSNINDGKPGTIYLGDVGSTAFEELNVIMEGGQNFGWPLFEGHLPHPQYSFALTPNYTMPNPLVGTDCDQTYFNFQDLILNPSTAKGYFPNPCDFTTNIADTHITFTAQLPLIGYTNRWNPPERAIVGVFEEASCEPAFYEIGDAASPVQGENFNGSSSIPGFFYTNTYNNFPSAYHNKYLHADFRGWIKVFDINENQQLKKVEDFLLDERKSITALVLNPLDGFLYYTDLAKDAIYKIGYNVPQAPTVILAFDQYYGSSPLTVNFEAAASYHPNNLSFDYAWDFGNGNNSTLANPSHTFTASSSQPETFKVRLSLTDEQGRSSEQEVKIFLNNTPPQVNISSFTDGDLYSVEEPTLLPLTAQVNDDEHSLDQLKFRWQVNLHHNQHVHAEKVDFAVISEAYLQPFGCKDEPYHYRIDLVVTDPEGLSTRVESSLYPKCGEEELIWESLSAETNETTTELLWQLKNPLNQVSFIIQKRKKGTLNYINIGVLENTNGANFSFVDEAPGYGTSVYLVKAVLPNELTFYSQEIEVEAALNAFIQITPNPVSNGHIYFNIDQLEKNTNITFLLYHANGACILKDQLQEHCQLISKNISHLPAGIYMYKLIFNKNVQQGKLIKMK